MRLVLNEKKGTFSLYYVNHETSLLLPERSFIAVMLDDQVYKLGSGAPFNKPRLGGTQSQPALVFESESFLVTVAFSFIRTVSASLNNGVTITVSLKNKGAAPVQAALKVVLNTRKKGKQVFSTDQGSISMETVFDKNSGERWWIAEDAELSIMGNIAGSVRPDTIQIAATTTLSGGRWKPEIGAKSLPNASSVSYYFDALTISPDQSLVFPIILAVADESGFAAPLFFEQTIPDALLIRQVTAFLDRSLATEAPIRDEELNALERILERLEAAVIGK
jgi:hypothetical protein